MICYKTSLNLTIHFHIHTQLHAVFYYVLEHKMRILQFPSHCVIQIYYIYLLTCLIQQIKNVNYIKRLSLFFLHVLAELSHLQAFAYSDLSIVHTERVHMGSQCHLQLLLLLKEY